MWPCVVIFHLEIHPSLQMLQEGEALLLALWVASWVAPVVSALARCMGLPGPCCSIPRLAMTQP